jgi:hypothetical protein
LPQAAKKRGRDKAGRRIRFVIWQRERVLIFWKEGERERISPLWRAPMFCVEVRFAPAEYGECPP